MGKTIMNKSDKKRLRINNIDHNFVKYINIKN